MSSIISRKIYNVFVILNKTSFPEDKILITPKYYIINSSNPILIDWRLLPVKNTVLKLIGQVL